MMDDDRLFGWVQSQEQYLGMIVKHPGVYRLNGRSFEIRPYDFILATPGSRCEIERHGEPPYEYVAFAFQFSEGTGDAAWMPFCKQVPDGEFWSKAFTRAARRVSVSMGMFKALVPAFIWSIAEFSAPASKNVYVAEAERLIAERLSEPIRISALAKEIGISQSQLNRHFLVENGSTPMQYILERRAELAHRLLTTTSLSLKEVARNCGFPNTHALSRFVRDRIGSAPRKVRARTSTSR
jgi:AraC-like DNA-binding protein